MATHEHIVTSADFADITCPYAGTPVKTVMVLNGTGEPLFRAADGTYSPRTRERTREAAQILASRRGGTASAAFPHRDAYTGLPLSAPEADEEGWWFPTAFSPLRVRPRAEYLYYMHMRDGKPDPRFPKPDGLDRVRAVKPPEPVRSARTVQGQDIKQDSLDFAKAAVEASGCAERSPTVAVPAPRRKGRRR